MPLLTALEEDVRELFAQLEAAAPRPATDLVYTALAERRRVRVLRLAFSFCGVVVLIVSLAAISASSRTSTVFTEPLFSESGQAVRDATSWVAVQSTLTGPDLVRHSIDWSPPGVEDRLASGVIAFDTVNSGGTVVGELWEDLDGTGTDFNLSRIENEELIWRANPASVWTGEEVLLVGGSNGPGIDTPAVAYNPSTETWRDLAEPPDYNAFSTELIGPGFWIGNRLLIPRAGVSYNPSTDEWSEIAEWPFDQDRTVAFIEEVPGGYVAWGGCNGPQCDDSNTGLVDDGTVYDAAADTWTEIADSPLQPGVQAVAQWARGELYVVTFPDGLLPLVAAYDPTLDRWRWLPAPPLGARVDAEIVLSDGSLIVWGGRKEVGSEPLASGALYSLADEAWFQLPEAPIGAAGHTMVDLGGRVYIGGAGGPSLLLSIPNLGTVNYIACVDDAGVDTGGAQVIWTDTGEVLWVKTGHDIPAEIHGTCLELIGGIDAGTSSWGPTEPPTEDQ